MSQNTSQSEMGKRSTSLKRQFKAIVMCCAMVFPAFSPRASAQDGSRETVLYSFMGLQDGATPFAGLTADPSGALYGTGATGGFGGCQEGGACGVVFKLSPPAQKGGAWTESVLYNFQDDDPSPPTSNLTFDPAGNLYGTTGGIEDASLIPSMFQLSQSNGSWNLNVVYENDLGGQIATPMLDRNGNLYTTVAGSFHNCCGFVLELSPQPGGTWSASILYKFRGGSDGANPLGGVIADRAGNLYGTTAGGGSAHCGTVFELSPQGLGSWAETVLYSFTSVHGCVPVSGLTFDQGGKLYGTTEFGGNGPCSNDCGVVFELSPPAQKDGSWTQTVIHTFNASDGFYPFASLAMDSAGALYGTTIRGGNGPCEPTGAGCGTVFHLSPPLQRGGTWIHSFYSFQGPDGSAPYGNVLLDERHGVLYGTTSAGGSYGLGTIFKVVR